MSPHRRRLRHGTEPVSGGSGTAEDALSPRRLALDEAVEQARGTPGEPAGFGTEATTTSTSDVLLDTYTVPGGRTARLVEASLSIQSNGEASVHVNGITFGPFTGSVDVSLPFERAHLTEGDSVKITHESTDGASTTTRAAVTAREV